MHEDLERLLLSAEDIDAIVTRLARQIDADYAAADKRLVLVCILKGSLMLTSDLMKHLAVPAEVEFMQVSSYRDGTHTSGRVDLVLELDRADLAACDVVIVEDIIDSGRTLAYLIDYLRVRGAKSIKTCTLFDKPDRREVAVRADYVGRVISDDFIVGYGMDYDERYRSLPYVGVLKPSVYEK